jgi:hypothetical protein
MSNYFENTKSSTEYHVMTEEVTASGTTVTLGSIGKLEPVPFVSISLEKYTVGDKTLGGVLNLSLEGVFYGQNFDDTASQLKSKIDTLADQHSCMTGINIKCGDTTIISSGIGYIRSYAFPQGPQKNWMNIIPYNIDVVITHQGTDPVVKPDGQLKLKYDIDNNTAIRSIRESVSWSLNENTLQMYNPDPSKYDTYVSAYTNEHIVVQYSLDIQGFGVCGTGCHDIAVLNALDSAKHVADYRIHNMQNLNTSSFSCDSSGLLPNNYDTTIRYDHTRDISVNELEGSLSVKGQYIVRPSGAKKDTLMTMESSADSSLDSGEKTVTLTGSIRGLVQNEYTTSGDGNGNHYSPKDSETLIDKKSTAMDAAELEMQNIMVSGTGIIKEIAKHNQLLKFNAAVGDNTGKTLANISSTNANTWQAGDSDNTEFRLLGKSIKRNYPNSTIDFTLTYSNKSRHKIANALWAEISIDHEMPSRRLVEHVIPGRGYPLMQDILCDTQDVFTINVTAQFEPNSNIKNIINAAREEILVLVYNTAVSLGIGGYIRTGDSENIANNGSYKRSIKLTSPTCNNITTSNTTLDYLEMPGDTFTNAAQLDLTTLNPEAFVQDDFETERGIIPASIPEFDKTRDKPE